MDVKHFKLVKTIVEEGNIANSSERLFLTQSALSHQLKELESRLGFKVFNRTRNKWKLTEEGEAFYTLANAVLETIQNGFSEIERIKSGSKGTIKLSTECYSFYQGLSAFIQKMGVLYPEIEVELILEATHHPISKLLSHEIDIAVVTSRPHQDSLTSIEIFEDEIFALVHKEHPLQSKVHLDSGDFENIHLIIHSFPLETVSVHERFLKPNNVCPSKISAIPLTEVALEMAEANMGITCLPKWALKSFKIPEHLVFKKIGVNGLKRTHYLVVRNEDRDKKYIDDFVSNFEEDFASYQDSLS